jgi:hypothetical protein
VDADEGDGAAVSGTGIDRRDRWLEITRPSSNAAVIRDDDGLDHLYIDIVKEGLMVSMQDNGAGGEYARSWVDITLDRESALELRNFIDQWLDTSVSLE